MNYLTTNLGEVSALVVAATWAFAVILFKKSGESVHPYALNMFKNLMAVVLIFPTIALMNRPFPTDLTSTDYFLLLLSGALGIGISDSLFFKSLNILGAGLSAIVDCLYSPFIIGFSMLILGERLTVMQIIGTVMIVSAIATAVRIKSAPNLSRNELFWGLFYGAMAMLTMAVGIVIIKPILERTALLWVTEIRLAGGILVLLIIFALEGKRKEILQTLVSDKRKIYTWTGSFLGAYLAMILWIMGMKYTEASIAAALNQTSNIFVFILAAIFLKERINFLRAVGIILGVAGATLIVI